MQVADITWTRREAEDYLRDVKEVVALGTDLLPKRQQQEVFLNLLSIEYCFSPDGEKKAKAAAAFESYQDSANVAKAQRALGADTELYRDAKAAFDASAGPVKPAYHVRVVPPPEHSARRPVEYWTASAETVRWETWKGDKITIDAAEADVKPRYRVDLGYRVDAGPTELTRWYNVREDALNFAKDNAKYRGAATVVDTTIEKVVETYEECGKAVASSSEMTAIRKAREGGRAAGTLADSANMARGEQYSAASKAVQAAVDDGTIVLSGDYWLDREIKCEFWMGFVGPPVVA